MDFLFSVLFDLVAEACFHGVAFLVRPVSRRLRSSDGVGTLVTIWMAAGACVGWRLLQGGGSDKLSAVATIVMAVVLVCALVSTMIWLDAPLRARPAGPVAKQAWGHPYRDGHGM